MDTVEPDDDVLTTEQFVELEREARADEQAMQVWLEAEEETKWEKRCYEGDDPEALIRADEQADEAEALEWIRDFAKAALYQHERWNLPGHLSLLAAVTGREYLLLDDEEYEHVLLTDRRFYVEELALS